MLSGYRIVTKLPNGTLGSFDNNWHRNSSPVRINWTSFPFSVYCVPYRREHRVLSCWCKIGLYPFSCSHRTDWRWGRFAWVMNWAWCLWGSVVLPTISFIFSVGRCSQAFFCLLQTQQQPRCELIRQFGHLRRCSADCRPCCDIAPSTPIFYGLFNIVTPMR